MMVRDIFVASLFLLWILVGCQSTPSKIEGIIKRSTPASLSLSDLFEKYGILSHQVGFMVWDPEQKKALTSYNPEKLFIPASVMKIFTTIAGLETLGSSYRFQTKLRYRGKISKGVLKGDLYLMGGGDPLLLARDLMRMANKLKQKKIFKVTGKFILDESRFQSYEQMVSDWGNAKSYNTSVSALSSEFNRFFVHWEEADEGKVRLHATPDLGLHTFKYLEDAKGFEYERKEEPSFGFPQVSSISGKEKLPVKQAGLHTGLLFREFCQMQGISLPAPEMGKTPKNSKTLLIHKSRSLVEITEAALEYSNNLVSTLIFLETARKLSGKTSTVDKANHMMATWLRKKLRMKSTFSVHDGSGLNSKSRTTAGQLIKALNFADKRSYGGCSYLSLLPIGGWTGTLSKRLSEPESAFRVWAKTGTLDYATAIAGYFYGKSNKKRVFALFTTDLEKKMFFMKDPEKKKASKNQAESWIKKSRDFQDKLLTQWILKF